MKKLAILFYLAMFSGLFFLMSCENDDDRAENMMEEVADDNIVATAQATSDLSLLVDALLKADEDDDYDFVQTLSGDGPFTVFAPTNAAFTALLEDLDGYASLDDFDDAADRDILATILQYHVVSGVAALSTDLTDGQTITTLLGDNLTVRIDGGVFIDDATDVDAEVVIPDVEASNGVVHVIDKVLLPQAVIDAINAKTIVDVAIDTDDLSSLVASLIQADAGLVETLADAGPFTVFAPTNTAFAALLEDLDGYSSLDDFDKEEDKEILATILTYHVVAGVAAFSTDLSDGQMVTTVQGEDLTIRLNGGVFIDDATDIDAQVILPDVEASNGVVHVIDKILLPQAIIDALNAKNIVDVAMETEDLSLLVGALVQADAGLVDTLSGEGPFTVFAPTNTAFAAALDALGPDYNSLEDFDTAAEKELLAEILKYHVVAGTAALSTDLSNGQMIPTVQGENVTITIHDGVFVGDATAETAQVVIPDVEASNGVVHVIDKVLLPQAVLDALSAKTIVDVAMETEELSSLVSALVQADAGLVETLAGDGPFTVFAPTNAAFADVLDALGADYNSLDDFDTAAEKELLAKILTYHVVAGTAALSTDLSNGQMIPTVQGENVTITIHDGVFVGDATAETAQVILPDVEADNGVVHIIDKVLLPQEAIDALGH